jgi:large subunit ribosomal protein L18
MSTKKKSLARLKIKRRVRGKLSGTSDRPRLSVFRSNKQIYAQIIDDLNGVTIASASSLSKESAKALPKLEQASNVGKMIAEEAKNAGVTTVVFDRNGYLFHGRFKQLADAARQGGLKF